MYSFRRYLDISKISPEILGRFLKVYCCKSGGYPKTSDARSFGWLPVILTLQRHVKRVLERGEVCFMEIESAFYGRDVWEAGTGRVSSINATFRHCRHCNVAFHDKAIQRNLPAIYKYSKL
jgi:hypothetical protein